MGYTANALGVVDDHAKGVISLFFYLPSESVTAAAASTGTFFAGMIPLVVFGEKQDEVVFDFSVVDVLHWQSSGSAPQEIQQTIWSEASPGSEEMAPSYIAIDCTGDDPKLVVNIQTKTPPTVSGWRYYIPSIDGWSSFDPGQPPNDTTEGNGAFPYDFGPIECDDPVEVSFVDSSTPATFRITNSTAITADARHHVLISYDLTAGCETNQVSYSNPAPDDTASQTSASCKFYIAIDDVNYTGATGIGDSWVDGGGGNDILPVSSNYADAFSIANAANISLFFDFFVGPASYVLSSPTVGGGPVGVPVTSDYSSENFKVRLAELQIFTGVSIDTVVEENRRAFVSSGVLPVSPLLAASLLGKQPDVRFQTVSDWQGGNNRGTSGDFTPAGTIVGVAAP